MLPSEREEGIMREVNVIYEEPRVSRFLFNSTTAAWLWLAARVYIGYFWLQAGWEKVTGTESGWHWAFTSSSWLKSSAGLKGFAGFALTNTKGPHAAVNYGWYASFLRWIEHSGGFLAPVIAVGEVAIGLALIFGALTGIAAFFAGTLSVSFGLAGVAGVNPLFLAIEFFLVLAWRNAGYIGLDRYLLPALGTPWHRGKVFERNKDRTPAPVVAAA
jgi:thiosulfate dehydrogenase (quinone) large subunit